MSTELTTEQILEPLAEIDFDPDVPPIEKKRGRPLKFDETRKKQFLVCLEKWGTQVLAADFVDVSPTTVMQHKNDDPVFAAQCEEAQKRREIRIVRQLEKEAMEGHTQPIFNKDGDEVGEKRIYETQLRLAMLKRYDPEYKDRVDVSAKVEGGAIIAPPAPMSLDDFEAEAEKHRNQMLEDQRALEEEMRQDGD